MSIDIDNELSPCPLCGAQATFLEGRISCDCCLCDLRKARNETSEQLVSNWNHRPTPPAPTPAAAETVRDFDHLKLTSWTDLENYGEKFCEAFNAGVTACAAPLPRQAAVQGEAQEAPEDAPELALNTMHKLCHQAADAFWTYWNENGETHKRGYYESTWGAINRAIRMVGVVPHKYNSPAPDIGIPAQAVPDGRYDELIYAVARKFPGETRHETALRYIRQAEANANSGSPAAVGAAPGESGQ